VPITLLAGFLGSGKTSTLLNVLENKEGLRVGVVVNDMAKINIDSKLISSASKSGRDATILDGEEAVELQNGCACCSLADELLTSVDSLMSNGREFDCVVVELSGVADPVAVKENWKQATLLKVHPVVEKAQVSRVVTVVDSSTFGTDWMSWDFVENRDDWVEDGDNHSTQRKVPELLAEQIEAADALVINKSDLAGKDQVETASSLASGINKDAELFVSEFGRVPFKSVLGLHTEDDAEVACSDPHDHSHGHNHVEESACTDPTCDDPSHSHSLSHNHSKEVTCLDPKCDDPSHGHSHSHDHPNEDSCSDPNCNDPSHNHDHSHSHDTPAESHGITSFVYKSASPFDTKRLLDLLSSWPVPIKDTLDVGEIVEATKTGCVMEDKIETSPFVGILRSKGFCWLAPTDWKGSSSDEWRHDTAMYWSHAGKHFGINTAGQWWGSITKEQMKGYFQLNMEEFDRILKEDWASEEWGDRRQEIVFIGVNLDESAIRDALDKCLCTVEEMDFYRENLVTSNNVEGITG